MAKPRQHRGNSTTPEGRSPAKSANAPGTIGSAAASSASGADGRPAIVWLRWSRVVVTVLIVLHLAAVVLPPLSVEPSGEESKLWQAVAKPFWPYIEAADLNHGYRFFGPDPGPGHLIRYHLEMPDGSSRDDVFPNLAEERPRLLYHRYFMLSEHLDGMFEAQSRLNEMRTNAERALPDNSPQRQAIEREYRAAEASYHAMVRSYADELLRRTGAKRVRMELVEHDFPSPDEFSKGIRLNDPSLYRDLADLGTFPEPTP